MDKESEAIPLNVGDRFILNGKEWQVSEVTIEEIRRNSYTGNRIDIKIEAAETSKALGKSYIG